MKARISDLIPVVFQGCGVIAKDAGIAVSVIIMMAVWFFASRGCCRHVEPASPLLT